MRIYLFLIFVVVFNHLSSQINPAPYQNFEFENYQPKWKHVFLDSTAIGNYIILGEDTLYNNGWSHISSGNNSYNHIVNNSSFISVLPTGLNFIEGGFIEKLDIKTGRSIWKNYFDLRNYDRKEWPYYIFLNSENILEILSFRQLYKDPWPLPNPLWLNSRLSKREYNPLTGILNNNYFADEFDSRTCKMANPFRLNSNLNIYLFPYQYGYQYIRQRPIDDKIEIINKFLNDSSYIIKDSLLYINYQYPQIKRSELFYITTDSLLFMMHSKVVDDNVQDSFEILLFWFDRNFNIIDSFNLSDDLPYSDNYRIVNTSNNSIIISGKSHFESNLIQFYSIFNFNGDLIETVYLKDNNNTPFILGFSSAIKLKYDTGSLFFSRDKQFGNWYLKIHKSDGNGNLTQLKSLKVIPNDHEIDPKYLYQLDNGDIILKCLDRNKDYYDRLEDPSAQVLVYFPAADLGIKTFVEDDITFEGKELSLYPNPSSENLNIEFSDRFDGFIQISDLMGRIILVKYIQSDSKTNVDISNLTKGIYFIRAVDSTGKGMYKSEMFIVE